MKKKRGQINQKECGTLRAIAPSPFPFSFHMILPLLVCGPKERRKRKGGRKRRREKREKRKWRMSECVNGLSFPSFLSVRTSCGTFEKIDLSPPLSDCPHNLLLVVVSDQWLLFLVTTHTVVDGGLEERSGGGNHCRVACKRSPWVEWFWWFASRASFELPSSSDMFLWLAVKPWDRDTAVHRRRCPIERCFGKK